MEEKLYGDLEFELKTADEDSCQPLSGIFELTYECNFDCVHCYCKGSEGLNRELTLVEIKNILGQLQSSGCVRVVFSGGDPLLRKDFLDIYEFARGLGLVIDIFTNAFNFTDKIISVFKKSPPLAIEVTLNAVSKNTFESITRKKDSFEVVIGNINKLIKNELPLVLKSNCLSLNKNEIVKIKSFSEKLFGAGSRRFKFDSVILPRLNGDKTPCALRLSGEELREILESDEDIRLEHQKSLSCIPGLSRDKKFMYQCSAWRKQFFINPFGMIKFCQFSEEFSLDLKKYTLKDYLSQIPPKVLNEEFNTDVECKNCRLRPFCYYCPARAQLETGSREKPVRYFCELARIREQDAKKAAVV